MQITRFKEWLAQKFNGLTVAEVLNDAGVQSGVTNISLETPTGDVDGVNDEFVFTAAPIIVFRNGVNETRLGTISTNTFTFGIPPQEGDDIEGII